MRRLTFGLGLATLTLPFIATCSDSVCEPGSHECPGTTPEAGAAGAAGAAGEGGDGSGGEAGEGGMGPTAGMAGASGEGGEGGMMGVGGAAGIGGMAGAGGGMNECIDDGSSPIEKPCLIDDRFAVFVAPSGLPTGSGTRNSPAASLQRGIELAVGSGVGRVIVCNAGYNEAVTVTESVAIYGGFVCPGQQGGWGYAAGTKATFAPSETGYVLEIAEVEGAVIIEDIVFEAADAEGEGESSVAAFVHGSDAVNLSRVTLQAGTGADGEDGVTSNVAYPPKSELDGVDGTATEGGVKSPVSCQAGGYSKGGAGGDADPSGGGPGEPDHPGSGGEAGTVGPDCVGKGGANAPAAANGGGATSLGELVATSWEPAQGSRGENGKPGQGGGGGAGAVTGGGGSGGAGSCGGAGGTPGKGGGASIALLAIDSMVLLAESELVSAAGGTGGFGDQGQQGQQEFGSKGNGMGDACQGGAGGLGANGGAGGGGAGGVSLGIMFRGAEPVRNDATMITNGAPGAAGPGGVGNNAGIAGIAQETFEVM